MNPQSFASILGAAGIVAATLAYIYRTVKETNKGFDKDTVSTMTFNIDALKEQNVLLKTENDTLRLRINDQDKLIAKLQSDIAYTQTMVTGKDQLVALQTTVEAHHKEVMSELATLKGIGNVSAQK